MAGYYSGLVNSFQDLKAAVESALATESWLADQGIYSKDGLFVRLSAVATWNGTGLAVNVGTGQSGSELVGAAPEEVRILDWPTTDPISWPANFEVHIGDSPDEVYVVLNYNVDRYQTLAFGRSPAPGNPTGHWISGTANTSLRDGSGESIYMSGSSYFVFRQSNATRGCGVLAAINWVGGQYCYRFHTGDGWGPTGQSHVDGMGLGIQYADALMRSTPSRANFGATLVPAYMFELAADNRTLPVLQLHHLRHCRIDHHTPGEVIEFGPDKWKLYPNFRKNAAEPLFAGARDHSGCHGFAVRYYGP